MPQATHSASPQAGEFTQTDAGRAHTDADLVALLRCCATHSCTATPRTRSGARSSRWPDAVVGQVVDD